MAWIGTGSGFDPHKVAGVCVFDLFRFVVFIDAGGAFLVVIINVCQIDV